MGGKMRSVDIGEPDWQNAFARNAARFANAPALLGDAASRSYNHAQLYDHIQNVGAALRRAGLIAGDRVALETLRGPFGAAVVLGIASFLTVAPMNPQCGPTDAEQALARAKPRAVIVAHPLGAIAAAARRLNLPVFVLDDDGMPVPSQASDLAAPSGGDPALCLLLPTSGTTGVPKLVPLRRSGLLHVAAGVEHLFALTEADRALNSLPLFHIHGLSIGLVAPLVAGGAVLLPEGRGGVEALDLAVQRGASWATGVPTFHHDLVMAAQARPDLAAACRLRFIRSASSPLPAPVRVGLELAFGVPVLEGYGMTEACSFITQQGPFAPTRHGELGAAQGLDLVIDGADGRTTAPGVVGEVLIRGPAVISGYFEGALPIAFTEDWLRTGDVGELDAAGNLRLVARLSEFINSGGIKVAPTEVEAALLTRPGVGAALVFGLPHATLGQSVVALIQPADPMHPPDPDQMRLDLHEVLSPEKVPNAIKVTATIPRAPTGKPDRKAGAAVFLRLSASTAQAPLTGPLEALVADLMQEVLPDNRRPGRNEDFFLLGGDSLAALRFSGRMQTLLGVPVPIELLFRQSSVSLLSEHVARVDGGRALRLIEEVVAVPPLPKETS